MPPSIESQRPDACAASKYRDQLPMSMLGTVLNYNMSNYKYQIRKTLIAKVPKSAIIKLPKYQSELPHQRLRVPIIYLIMYPDSKVPNQ